MPDYPPGYDPTFDFEMGQNGFIALGLISLAAFGMVGVGAFFGATAVAEGTIGSAITINGVEYYGITEAEAAVIASIGEGPISMEAAEALATLGEAGTPPVLSAAGFLVLDQYNTTLTNPGRYPYFGHYLGGNPGADVGPGFFGGNVVFIHHDGGGVGPGRVCINLGPGLGQEWCYFDY